MYLTSMVDCMVSLVVLDIIFVPTLPNSEGGGSTSTFDASRGE